MKSLLDQLKKRRLDLGIKQHDMMMRVGVSRQQYQRLESKGNPRLTTLELIAKGLESKLMLVPQEKLSTVLAVLAAEDTNPDHLPENIQNNPTIEETEQHSISDDPWQGLLEGQK